MKPTHAPLIRLHCVLPAVVPVALSVVLGACGAAPPPIEADVRSRYGERGDVLFDQGAFDLDDASDADAAAFDSFSLAHRGEDASAFSSTTASAVLPANLQRGHWLVRVVVNGMISDAKVMLVQ